MVAMTRFVQVTTTMPSYRQANRIANKLLSERIAACVQVIGPIKSNYWWKGKIEQTKEWLCLIKSKAEDYAALETMIRQTHPYEIPEILAMPIVALSPSYMKWLRAETEKTERKP